MNLAIIQWLLAHRDLLAQIYDIVKDWKKDLPFMSQWEIADKVARLVIPVIEPHDAKAMMESWGLDEADAFAMGAQAGALNVDWQQLITVIVPILQMILKILAPQPA